MMNRLYSFILYALGFLLLNEWFQPLGIISNTGAIHYFLIFAGIGLLLYWLKIASWVRFVIKLGLIYFFLKAVFASNEVGTLLWGKELLIDIKDNIQIIFSGQFYDLTNLFRTLLVYLLIWITVYLIHYWVISHKRIFSFYIMTILYVTVLDTFTQYNGEMAIIRIVIAGFVLLALLFIKRFFEEEKIEFKAVTFNRWITPFLILLGVSILVGYHTPKAGPIWPDPISFIESQADNIYPRHNRVSKIGYGFDDSRLGGPFIPDEQVVFEAQSHSREYWRVETKDVYTGKGWVTSREPEPVGRLLSGEENIIGFPIHSYESVRSAVITMKMPYPHLVLPYGFFSVIGNEDGFFQYDRTLTKLLSFQDDETPVSLEEYEVHYYKPRYSLKNLRSTVSISENEMDQENYERYTQLPDSLPDRVRQLAEEITAGSTNWYDKAKDIERYFHNNGFVYDYTNVAVPGKDEDYVDQFLFETKRGYCDNFSTAMVTLLRSIGIPARWAKGYAPGTYLGVSDDHYSLYEITNNDAHSWVEVYFPTEGWVPFEPTIGFQNPNQYNYDEDYQDALDGSPENESSDEEPTEDDEAEEEIEDEEIDETDDETIPVGTTDNDDEGFSPWWIGAPAIMISILVIGSIMYVKRRKWIPVFLVWYYKRKRDKDVMVDAYGNLLRQLERYGLKRDTGQTLRDYAKRVDSHFNSQDMSTLTERYERAIYRGDQTYADWEHVKELWENLIKKATS